MTPHKRYTLFLHARRVLLFREAWARMKAGFEYMAWVRAQQRLRQAREDLRLSVWEARRRRIDIPTREIDSVACGCGRLVYAGDGVCDDCRMRQSFGIIKAGEPVAGTACPECCKPGALAGVRPKGSKGKCPTCHGKLWVKGSAP